ncbi:MAG: acyl-CoA thioesterase [Candidatus Brocadiia bacterium]
MGSHVTTTEFRVRYSETDRMDTIYNSRVLEWFEMGRTEYLREIGIPYRGMEERGILLPVIEAHVEYRGRATYDDLLRMETRAMMPSPLRLKCEIQISHARSGDPVARGYTIHALTNADGTPSRPPESFLDAVRRAI